MANRYWVGGAGSWDTASTLHWSASSGGASGASVPTAADSVFFDQAGTYTVTMTGALLCLDITVSAGAVTFATGTTPTIAISGSMSLLAGTVWSSTGAITFNATTTGKTITTNGVTLTPSITINGTGGGWTLGSALTSPATFILNGGALDLSGYTLTVGAFNAQTGSTTRSLNFNSGTVVVNESVTGLPWNTNTTGFTVSGTGTISSTTSTVARTIVGSSLNYSGITLNLSVGTGAVTITGTQTWAAITTTSSVVGSGSVLLSANQTVTGAFTTSGTAGNKRVLVASSTAGQSYQLTLNSTPSLTDVDFRDIYVTGTASPVSGTRIGNRGRVQGVTFSTPKTVYWNLAGAQNWSANGWASTSGGTPSTDYFPLPQDTAVFNNTGSVTGTINLDTALQYVPTVDMSARTSAMTLSLGVAQTVYGSWINGSGTTITLTGVLTFSPDVNGTSTITSAGKAFTCSIIIDTIGGTVQLADALNIGALNFTVTNGTFTTNGYAVTANFLSSSNTNVRTINLGASTLTLSSTTPITLTTSTNLTFNAGTSQINCTASGLITFAGSGLTYYNVSLTGVPNNTSTISGANAFNNLTLTAPATGSIQLVLFSANQTINGTLTVSSSAATSRLFIRSDTSGTTRTLTCAAVSIPDCDFQDITLAGAAAGSSPTRAGNCGGNTGITFPAAKTVYWNLVGAQNWSGTGWATSSGGTPALNNFPLAQDTAVFDNTGSVTGILTVNAAWNIGTLDMSARTSAMTLATLTNSPNFYGDWKNGSGTTLTGTGVIYFTGRANTQTITSAGKSFTQYIYFQNIGGTVQLADALTSTNANPFVLRAGTFDAVSYNVTIPNFDSSTTTFTRVLKMGSGTWTLTGTGAVWNVNSGNLSLIVGTSNIVLSDTSTTARSFTGGALYYPKITIGGTTGISTTTFGNSDVIAELASTKTVAHTIALGVTAPTYGKWSVTGALGNVVTVTGTPTITIAGARVSGVDYLAMGTTSISTTSPGEFYAGANSTGTGAGVILTAAPTPVTRYWRGGTGTWDATTTTNWSTSSGGSGGASVPTSADDVIFDSTSNTTAYTVTCTATILRCASLTMGAPASGAVTWAGTAPLAVHGNFAMTGGTAGITRSWTGALTFSGSATGKTINSNGIVFSQGCTINGIGSGWTQTSALDLSTITGLTVTNGSFDTGNYAFSAALIASNNNNVRSLSLGSSTINLNGYATPISFSSTNLTFNAGTSQINCILASTVTFDGGGLTFYNVSCTTASTGNKTFTGVNTFNNLSFTAPAAGSINNLTFNSNQTINGTLTVSSSAATGRLFIKSNTFGTTRTLTCAAISISDCDFQDITLAGVAAGSSPTRAGNCGGNSGITFPTAKTVYWNLAGAQNWSATGWATSSGGTPAVNNFPLAQDTAVFDNTGSVTGTITLNAIWNIGTVDMSARTSAMTLATSAAPFIYSDWKNGSGTTLSGTNILSFSGRGVTQTITSAGKTFTQPITIQNISGTVQLADALTTSAAASAIALTAGTFNLAGFTCTLSGTGNATGFVSTTTTYARAINFGSGGSIVVAQSGTTAWNISATNFSVSGTGTISLTNSIAKTFSGGGATYSGVTLNNAGAGALTISGSNTLANITSTSVPSTIIFPNGYQVLSSFTAAGTSGNLLTLQGTTASILIISSGTVSSDYLSMTNMLARGGATWYAGSNSTNGGGNSVWLFSAAPAATNSGAFFSLLMIN